MQALNKPFAKTNRPSDVSKFSMSSKSDRITFLKPFGNQVSGRANILCYNSTTICKPYVSRELFFYHHLPTVFKNFVPEFRGIINVTYVEGGGGDSSVTAIAHTKSLIKRSSSSIKALVETPRPHSKRCVQDYGRTHVIDPTNPRITSLRPKEGIGGEFTRLPETDILDELTQGFDENVSIQAVDGREARVEFRSAEDDRQQNPWNSKVMTDVWTKLKNVQSEEGILPKSKRFMMLENVTASYGRPCILDLKVGTRVRENASPAKLARHVTAIDVGVRMSGMQIYDPERMEYIYINKYYGHNLSVDGLVSNLIDFFSRGHSPIVRMGGQETSNSAVTDTSLDSSFDIELLKYRNLDCNLIESAIVQLLELRHAVASLISYRFYSGSLLLVYEGDCGSSKEATETIQVNPDGEVAHKKASAGSPGGGKDSSYRPHKCTKHTKRAACRPNSFPSARGDFHVVEDCKEAVNVRGWKPATARSSRSPSHSKIPQEHARSSSKPLLQQSVKEITTKKRHRTKSCGSLANCFTTSGRDTALPCNRYTDTPQTRAIDIRLIDFAHYCFSDSIVHPGPDGGFLFGIDNLISLLRKMSTNALAASTLAK